MSNELKEFFIYTRSERNGLFVLVVICVGLLITPTIYQRFFKRETKTDFSEFQSQIDSFFDTPNQEMEAIEKSILFDFNPNNASKETFQQLGLSEKVASTIENYRNKGGKFYKKEDFKKIYGIEDADYERLEAYIVFESDFRMKDFEKEMVTEEKKKTFQLFEFDPNTASKEDFERLGLSPKVIKTMMNYRNKGGTFRKREDIGKIYGLSEDDFERLFPYIKIVEQEPEKVLPINEKRPLQNSKDAQAVIKIEINSASPEEWQQLRGIGPFYAKMICRFRDALGGFSSIDQISETYNLPDSTFQTIKPYLILNGTVKKIKLNIASDKALAAHPYFNWKQANAIVKYREQHGDFTSVQELEKIKLLKKETLEKVKPYLEIN